MRFYGIALALDASIVASGSTSGTICIWEVSSGLFCCADRPWGCGSRSVLYDWCYRPDACSAPPVVGFLTGGSPNGCTSPARACVHWPRAAS